MPFVGRVVAPFVTQPPAKQLNHKERSDMSDLPLAPWKDERAQNIAEYALIAAIIVLLTVGAIHYFWSALNHMGQ